MYKRQVLREKVEGLKYKPEVQTVKPYFILRRFFRRVAVEYYLPADRYSAALGKFKEIKAAQKGRFTAARRPDD